MPMIIPQTNSAAYTQSSVPVTPLPQGAPASGTDIPASTSAGTLQHARNQGAARQTQLRDQLGQQALHKFIGNIHSKMLERGMINPYQRQSEEIKTPALKGELFAFTAFKELNKAQSAKVLEKSATMKADKWKEKKKTIKKRIESRQEQVKNISNRSPRYGAVTKEGIAPLPQCA